VSISVVTVAVAIIISLSDRTEVPPEELPADSSAKGATVFERMAIVKTSVDARPKDLFEQVTRVVEGVRMNTIAEGQAVYNDVHLARPKVIPDQAGNYPRNAPVRRRIFRVARSGA
jgi:hypothetical protein